MQRHNSVGAPRPLRGPEPACTITQALDGLEALRAERALRRWEVRVGTQARIIGAAFIVFGVVAWISQTFSIAYIGLMIFGLIALIIGWLVSR